MILFQALKADASDMKLLECPSRQARLRAKLTLIKSPAMGGPRGDSQATSEVEAFLGGKESGCPSLMVELNETKSPLPEKESSSLCLWCPVEKTYFLF